mgnify:CR=1 FL=1
MSDIPSSGTIRLDQIHTEAGGTSGTACSLNEADIRGLIGKSAGTLMSFSEWYGAAAEFTVQFTLTGWSTNLPGAARNQSYGWQTYNNRGAATTAVSKSSFFGGADVDITSGISLLSTTQSSENGDSIESIDNIKYLAPRVYASQYRAVTPNDYKSLIPFLYPNIDSVSAYGGEELDPPEFGKVYITVKPKNGEFLSAVTKDSIKNDLKKYTVAGIKQEFLDLMYLYVEYNSTVAYDSGFISDLSLIHI